MLFLFALDYRDAHTFCMFDVQCQVQGLFSRRHELSLSKILEHYLFDVWGIYFIRSYPSYFIKKYILVVVNYVSKWVESLEYLTMKGGV